MKKDIILREEVSFNVRAVNILDSEKNEEAIKVYGKIGFIRLVIC